jgi:hypothetical protein
VHVLELERSVESSLYRKDGGALCSMRNDECNPLRTKQITVMLPGSYWIPSADAFVPARCIFLNHFVNVCASQKDLENKVTRFSDLPTIYSAQMREKCKQITL